MLSTQSFHGPCLHSWTVPLLRMSTEHAQVALVLQATNAGVGRPGYVVSYPNAVANWCGKVSDVHLVIVNPEKIV